MPKNKEVKVIKKPTQVVASTPKVEEVTSEYVQLVDRRAELLGLIKVLEDNRFSRIGDINVALGQVNARIAEVEQGK